MHKYALCTLGLAAPEHKQLTGALVHFFTPGRILNIVCLSRFLADTWLCLFSTLLIDSTLTEMAIFFYGITLTDERVKKVSNEAKILKENESGGILRWNVPKIEKSGKMLKSS